MKKFLIIALVALCLIIFAFAFSKEAIFTYLNHLRVVEELKNPFTSKNANLTLKQLIQKTYSKKNIYIPTDHILIKENENQINTDDNEILKLFPEACPKGQIFVLLPLHFNFPFFGATVIERCLLVK